MTLPRPVPSPTPAGAAEYSTTPATAAPAARTRRGSDYAELSRRVRRAGLLEPRHGRYAFRFALLLSLFTGGWAAFSLLGNSWWQLLVAALLGLLFTQMAYLGHDIGHKQVFRSRRTAKAVGMLLGNLGTGISYGWWVGKHTRHHTTPNDEDHDPDISMGTVLAWTRAQTRDRTGPKRLLAKYQAVMFFPLLFLEGLAMHIDSIRALRRDRIWQRPLETTLLGLHLVAYPVAVCTVLSPAYALAFVAVQQGVWGFTMAATFAPNHKGMPFMDGKDDYLRRQVLTSRNVRGGPVVDVAFGGLNHQIEHHLFPSMPRPNLRHAKPIVRAYCGELGIPYHETGLLRSYREALTYLYETGEPAR